MSASGKLNEHEQSEANENHGEREEDPADVFLEPGSRKYPVKTKQDGKWAYSRDLLLAAAREARMHGHRDLAEHADAIRKREFDGAEDAALAFDRESLREFDRDGRLHVFSTPITKAAVDEYLGREIPGAEALGLEPDRRYKLLRHPDELKKALGSANNQPVMIKHIRQSAEEPQKDKIVGSTGTDAKYVHPHVRNSMVIWDQDGIDGVQDNTRREISGSYHYKPDMTPGVYEGQPYDGVMRDIEFNHFALVGEGRVGHDVLVEDELPPELRGPTMKVSRRAMVAQGALAGWLTPLLANDAKLPDLKPVVLGATAANWAQAKPQIIARLTQAMTGRLAKDANLRQVHGFLDSLDHEGQDQMEPDEMEVVDRKARDGLADPEMRERGQEHLGGDAQRARDKAARDKAATGWAADEEPESEEEMKKRHEREAKDRANDAETEEKMKERQEKEARDAKTARDARRARDTKARDESAGEKERREREEREGREKERAEDRRAMDQKISEAIQANDRKHTAIREAEQFVRPWIGEIVMAQDSAEAVYRLTLDMLGVPHKGKHPDALRDIIATQPKPGARPDAAPRMAMDASGTDAMAKRFPNLAAVRRY